ncbi:DUF1972 domain-containing protein [Sphingomonas sp. ABOLG]|uniref:DUF1972 domain-containing protein n=1 Tax=Sphingomonas sp. ABOLG TaxID=1985880 RepID=UPI000F7E66D3|nr:DUF1972 domain-containing protein [Sphingomonas sp. ABOLG]RSV14198.1 DUF1972 domain-containing protein [Sphingomonas sp. ABOLG]
MTSAKAIPLVGTVGVPARYGGFETLAEQLCRHVCARDVPFIVYCERSAYGQDERGADFAGHRRIFLPLRANGVASMFHDALALIDAVFRRNADQVFIFGYSGAWILPVLKMVRPRVRYIVNVDGMEWRRDKFSTPARLLLKALEWCAARTASVVIADNDALADLFRERYRNEPVVIAYGGDHTVLPATSPADVAVFEAAPRGHYLAIARIEPENNTETIIQGCIAAGVPLVFIGNWRANAYGLALRELYGDATGITLLDPIYDQAGLEPWRAGAIGYIHGHSVGGTNPSLVEALFHTSRMASFDCAFNRATLSGAGSYFTDADSLAVLLRDGLTPIEDEELAQLRATYRWDAIAARYLGLLQR